MKQWPEIDNCYNCDEVYDVPTDHKGLLKVDGEGTYLCERCRVNPNVKMEDYRNKVKCMNDLCEYTFWIPKRRSQHLIECRTCLLKRKG